MSHKPAGGPKSRNIVAPKYRTGAPNRAIRPGGAGQIGISIGTHITAKRTESNYRGAKFFGGAAIPSKLGNKFVNTVGVGGGRQVMPAGQQGQHGSVVQGGPRIANTKGQWPDSKR